MSTHKNRVQVKMTTVLTVLVPEGADAADRHAALATAVYEAEQAINSTTRHRAHSSMGCDGWVIPFTSGYAALRSLSVDELEGLLTDTDTETETGRLCRRQIEYALSAHAGRASGG